MKKLFAMLIAAVMVLSFAACAAPATEETAAPEETVPEAEPVELIVFAAASMTETMNQIAELYKAKAPNVTLTYNFDSSGTLKTQIQEGAECDLFISAGQKQMNQLDITADPEVNTDKLDFVLEGTRINLLENRVTLCAPEGNPKDIKSFDDLADKLKEGSVLMAMGNSDVPVGQYTQKIKEVTTQVTEASVDCGVVYCTDAFSAGLTPVDYATKEMCGQVIYPAAVLNISKNQEAAKEFLAYLQTDEAMKVFEAVGFASVA